MNAPNHRYVLLFVLLSFFACETTYIPKEEDQIFHGGPAHNGIGATFFMLYKNNKYQFCEGGAFAPGCYTGDFDLVGDTLHLHNLKFDYRVPSSRLLIRRYKEMDSNYWKCKYPNKKEKWASMRQHDLGLYEDGDILYLDSTGKTIFDEGNYFVIRLDSLNK